MGETGPTGPAATIQVGSVTTGEPGTPVEITNSGTENDAIFDFVIPRGATGPAGGGGTPEVLATVDTSAQASTTNGALVFNDVPLVSGTAITHQAGTTDILITQPGIYQAAFQGAVSVSAGTAIPATIRVRLTENGANVPGASAIHTFTSSSELATLPFTAPFQVTTVPTTIQVVASLDGFNFDEIALTIVRLGDATATVTAAL